MKCSICKENTAVVFITKEEEGRQKQIGMCIPCAKKQGLAPMDQIMRQVKLSPEDIDNINKQMMDVLQDPEVSSELNELMDTFSNSMGFNMEAINNYMNVSDDDEDEDDEDEIIMYSDEDDEQENKFKKVFPFKTKTKTKRRPKKKNLDNFGINLTDRAKEGLVDRIIGRHREVDRLIQILNRRQKNNPVLIGEPGVGKTAIAEGLAVRIAQKEVPVKLLDTEVYLLDLTALVSGTQFRGQFEGRMKAIIKEASESGNIIIVIDELHNITGAGSADSGTMNAANILKPALAKGEIQIIGATTIDEYRKHIEKDTALERRFQPILVEEPTDEETVEIIKGIKDYYESYHHVLIPDNIIEYAVRMSNRYIYDRFLPDKAIDVIDEAGSRANLKNLGLVELEALKNELAKVVDQKEVAASEDDFETAAECRMQELNLENKIDELKKQCENVQITEDDIAYVIEAWTKIPVQDISEHEAEKLIKLEDRLARHVKGQNEAIEKLSKAIRRKRSGFQQKRRPASFIFVGPTGVGKTELAKALARELFNDEEALIRFDMSEFMEKHTASKLIGAPPGYVGYEQAGQLTEKVRRRPYSVLLLDEIEKAHPDVFNLLLQIMEDARLTDSQGRVVNFENTIIIMTSNAGSNLGSEPIGFTNNLSRGVKLKAKDALKDIFRPEFLNRIDDIIAFNSLSEEILKEIIDVMLEEVYRATQENGFKLLLDDEVKDYLISHSYDEKYGARPLRRAIMTHIEDELAEAYLRGQLKDIKRVEFYMEGKEVKYRIY